MYGLQRWEVFVLQGGSVSTEPRQMVQLAGLEVSATLDRMCMDCDSDYDPGEAVSLP